MGNIFQLLSRGKFMLDAAYNKKINNNYLRSFVDNIILNNSINPEFDIIEKEREHLRTKGGLLEVTDFSSKKKGRKPYITEVRKISDIVKNESCKPKVASLLFTIIQHTNSTHILELGTSFGISTAYMSFANPKAYITSIEGCYGLSDMASQLFKKLKLDNILIENGNIDFLLPGIVSNINKLDLVFFDIFRNKSTLIQYFDTCTSLIHENSIFVINNIHESKEMKEGWNTIINKPNVRGSIELYECGIIFFKDSLNGDHIKLSY
jgi:predicted O-methyltransferase YrrM